MPEAERLLPCDDSILSALRTRGPINYDQNVWAEGKYSKALKKGFIMNNDYT
jgi:hypothetical protein